MRKSRSRGILPHRVPQPFLQVSPTIDFSFAAIGLTLLNPKPLELGVEYVVTLTLHLAVGSAVL
ncbi:hypothetical protein WL14_03505 [Burkholderia cepacia]|nr:hypothetical protein WL14_03505 [Burkholderia cepacia]